MRLTHLTLSNFRNYSQLDLEVPNGTSIFTGDNAQGKTSLIEAIYFLSTATSFQSGSDSQLIRFTAAKEPIAVGRVVADYIRGGRNHQIEFRIIQERNEYNGFTRVRKEVLLDGVKHKLNQIVGHFSAVLFLPQTLRIVDGSPSDRRRYLNLTLSQGFSEYTARLSAYKKAVAQRNALLKQLGERGGDHDQLLYWEEKISGEGAFLIASRIEAIKELEDLAMDIHKELTRGEEEFHINYEPGFNLTQHKTGRIPMAQDSSMEGDSPTLDAIRKGFQEDLINKRPLEIHRGQTTIGPHRDEIRFLSNGIDLGKFGSRGQIRTIMLSLKIAEINWIKKRTGHWPVLLLDEVLAELDPLRREDLLTRLVASEQALLTTTDLDLFSEKFVRKARLWIVKGGEVGEIQNIASG